MNAMLALLYIEWLKIHVAIAVTVLVGMLMVVRFVTVGRTSLIYAEREHASNDGNNSNKNNNIIR